jgi:hypothetical protein
VAVALAIVDEFKPSVGDHSKVVEELKTGSAKSTLEFWQIKVSVTVISGKSKGSTVIVISSVAVHPPVSVSTVKV